MLHLKVESPLCSHSEISEVESLVVLDLSVVQCLIVIIEFIGVLLATSLWSPLHIAPNANNKSRFVKKQEKKKGQLFPKFQHCLIES